MKRNLRFAALLPMLMLVLAILSDTTGDSQEKRLVQANVGRYGYREALPAYYAIARYLDYGLNAPAWLLSVKMPFFFPKQDTSCCGFISGEKDWEYLAFVVTTWYLIGKLLDRRRAHADPGKFSGSSWRSRATRGLCGLYGAFLCYSVLEFYESPWNYPRWFVVPVALWGAGLILASVYPFSAARMKNWYRVLSGFVAVAGVFYIEAGAQLYKYRVSFGAWSVAMFFAWGVLAIMSSAYLFRMSNKSLNQVKQ